MVQDLGLIQNKYRNVWLLPHSAPSWILSKAENLASTSLQDEATLNSTYLATWGYLATYAAIPRKGLVEFTSQVRIILYVSLSLL